MVFLEEGRADSGTLPHAFGEGWNMSSTFWGNFSITWDLSVETVQSRFGRLGLISYTPEALRLRGKRKPAQCAFAGISMPIQLSAQEQVFSLQPQCAFSLCIGADPGSKKQNLKTNIHFPFPEKDLHLHCHTGPKSYHWEVQTFKLMCLLINESAAQSEKLSRSPCKTRVWLKGAEEQEARHNLGPPKWQQAPHRRAGPVSAGWAAEPGHSVMKLGTDDETESFITGRIERFSFGEEEENVFVVVQSIGITSHPDFHSPLWFLGTGFRSTSKAKLPSDLTKIRP